ncbi:hypothetical protein BGX34_007955 [Mortierella sp. NVP85]|nr:hypothetical protein BGX34_007955 [Mortierella sp. NVP85]
MEVAQSFSLSGETDIIKIPCHQVEGQYVVHWEDIEQKFPGVKYVTFMKDSCQTRVLPSIKYYPGVVLDVVLSIADGNESTTVGRAGNSTDASSDVVERLKFAPPGDTFSHDNNIGTMSIYSVPQHQNSPLDVRSDNKTALLHQFTEIARTLSTEQQLLSTRPSDFQVQGRTSTTMLESLIQVIGNGLGEVNNNVSEVKNMVYENMKLTARVHELQKALEAKQDALDAKQDEMKQLQIQALDRLALLQNSVKAVLTQTYELHEYPTPRLFIVLPNDTSSWNPSDFFSNKFRLYFLCECGEHTKVTNSKIPHHIHLAKHKGYEIDRPNEFFQQYGSYVLTILRMLKFCISAADIVIPALSKLVLVDVLDQATDSLKSLTSTIKPGVDQVINHFEEVSTDEEWTLGGNEALEGADLRQLETFLRKNDENRVLGDLYRTVTTEGHVKWVCIDHYRENYHEKAVKAFHDTMRLLHGTFDENAGRVKMRLISRIQAEQFYVALVKAKNVHELKLELDWETSQSDLKKLRDTLTQTNVGVLELCMTQLDGPARDVLNRNQRYDPILDIMRHPSIQSFTIRGQCDFTKRSSILSRDHEFSNLRHLGISLDQLRDDTPAFKRLLAKASNLSSLALGSSVEHSQASLGGIIGDLIYPHTLRRLDIPLYQLKDDIPGVKRLIARASNLSSLVLRTGILGEDNNYALQIYNAIAERRTYSINFEDWNLFLPPPPTESNQSIATQQCMEHLLKYYCASSSAQDLDKTVLMLFWNAMRSPGGLPIEDVGRMEVKLRSSIQAQHFYYVLKKTGSTHELRIELEWEATLNDLERLRDALAATNVNVLELYLNGRHVPNNDRQLCDPILDIMQHRSIQSFTIRGSQYFSSRSRLLSRSEDFSNLRHLDISLCQLKDDIPDVTRLIANASNLSSLALSTGTLKDNNYALQIINAIAERRTYSIQFKDWDLCLPSPPSTESDQFMAVQQCMEHILKFYYAAESAHDLNSNVPKLFWNMVKPLGEPSVEDVGRVEVKLRSSAQAQHFYYVLERARSTHELRIELDWEATLSDLEKLRDALTTINVNVLELYLNERHVPTNDSQLYDPILEIMQHRSIQSFMIRGPQDFSHRSSILSRNCDFSNLQHLDISLYEMKNDIPGATSLITRASNLSSLALGTDRLRHYIRLALNICNLIAEHWTYPINFKNWNITIPPPPRGSDQSMAIRQCMEHLLAPYYKAAGGRLDVNYLDELTADALTKETENGSGFNELYLSRNGQLGDAFINNLSSIVGRSELRDIIFYTGEDAGRLRILEWIQWKHLCVLYIYLAPGTFETSVMRVLVDGVKKMSEKVKLERFKFWTESWCIPVILPEGDLLQVFVASTSIQWLELRVDMTLEHILSLLRSVDFSRMHHLELWAEGFDSVKVDAILDGLQHAKDLRKLHLIQADFTDEQRRRMSMKGISLVNAEGRF